MAHRALLIAAIVGSLTRCGAFFCSFECPNGAGLVERESYEATTNGCGVQGFKIKSDFDFTACCNEHDLCFQRCGSDFSQCNEEFHACMTERCRDEDNQEQCEAMAGMYNLGVSFGGCEFFKDAQRAACDCGDGYAPPPPDHSSLADAMGGGGGGGGDDELDLSALFAGLQDVFADSDDHNVGDLLGGAGDGDGDADGDGDGDGDDVGGIDM